MAMKEVNASPISRDEEDLVERLSKASGPDRELDARILCALAAPKSAYVSQSPFNGEWCIYNGISSRSGRPQLWEDTSWYRTGGWPLTSSLDASLALVERLLPDHCWQVRRGFQSEAIVWVIGRDYDEGAGLPYSHHVTPALALLTALITALITTPSKEKSDAE